MSERAAHQCHKDGCDSEATHRVKVTIICRAPGCAPIPVKMDATIRVCSKHAVEGDVRKYLMQPQNREAITTGLMEGGYPEPDFLGCGITFEPIEDRFVAVAATPVTRCDVKGCGKRAMWQVEQHFRMLWQRGKGKPQITTLSNISVCDEHKHTIKPADFRGKQEESDTRAWLAERGVSMPDFKSMTLGFIPLAGGKPVTPRIWAGENAPVDQWRK